MFLIFLQRMILKILKRKKLRLTYDFKLVEGRNLHLPYVNAVGCHNCDRSNISK
jgi:hypothetical protein